VDDAGKLGASPLWAFFGERAPALAASVPSIGNPDEIARRLNVTMAGQESPSRLPSPPAPIF